MAAPREAVQIDMESPLPHTLSRRTADTMSFSHSTAWEAEHVVALQRYACQKRQGALAPPIDQSLHAAASRTVTCEMRPSLNRKQTFRVTVRSPLGQSTHRGFPNGLVGV